MKAIVVDESVSFSLVTQLRAMGWSVNSIGEEKGKYSDEKVYSKAIREKAILITRDYHFTNPIRFNVKPTMGIIYIRHGNLTSEEEVELCLGFLSTWDMNDIRNKLVTLYRNETKLR